MIKLKEDTTVSHGPDQPVTHGTPRKENLKYYCKAFLKLNKRQCAAKNKTKMALFNNFEKFCPEDVHYLNTKFKRYHSKVSQKAPVANSLNRNEH